MISSLSFVSVFVFAASLVLEPPRGNGLPACSSFRDEDNPMAQTRTNPKARLCCARPDCGWSNGPTCYAKPSGSSNHCYPGSASKSADTVAASTPVAALAPVAASTPVAARWDGQDAAVAPVVRVAASTLLPSRPQWWNDFKAEKPDDAQVLEDGNLVDFEAKTLLNLVEVKAGYPRKDGNIDGWTIKELFDAEILLDRDQTIPRINAAKELLKFLRASSITITIHVRPYNPPDKASQKALGNRRFDLAKKVLGMTRPAKNINAHDDKGTDFEKRGFEVRWASDKYSGPRT